MEGIAIALNDMMSELKGGPKKDDYGNTLHQAGHREENSSLPGVGIISTAIALNPGFYKAGLSHIATPVAANNLQNNLAYRGPAPKAPTPSGL